MKVLERIALILFSYIALFLSIMMCLFVFGWVDMSFAQSLLSIVIYDPNYSKIVLAASVVIILLATKCIFFDSTGKELAKQKEGIVLENDDGRLLISKDTLESLISSVSKGFNGAENVQSKVYVNKDGDLSVSVTLYVHPNAVIKDLSSNLQSKIKEAIKNTSDLDVKEVNIQVKDIAPDKITEPSNS